MDGLHIFSGGSFSLDPGAIFGMVPESSWGRYYSVNEKGRIRLAVNIPVLKRGEKLFTFDSGLNQGLTERSKSFFEVSQNPDLGDQIMDM
ncbi:metal dependent hydrolase, partial [mine drainage metagenome]